MDELPQVLNPISNFIQNCNQSPFTVTDDGNPAIGDFPSYMIGERHDDKRRAKVSRMLLRNMYDLTLDELNEAAYDTTIYWAVAELPRFELALQNVRRTDPALADEVAPYFDHLLDWDCKGSIDSTQATLCFAWYEALYADGYRSETLDRKYQTDDAEKFRALIGAAKKLEGLYGSWRVPYGQIHRLQRHAQVADLFKVPFSDQQNSLPSAGLQGPLGVVFNMYFTPTINIPLIKKNDLRFGVVGNSYMSVVEFGDRVESRSVLQYGVSGDPNSPHFFDQAKLVSEQRLKPQLFHWDDVVAGAKRKYHPGEEMPSTEAQAGR